MRASRTTIRPERSAALSASPLMPLTSNARNTVASRPLSSTATSESTFCAGSGSRRTRSRNSRSTFGVNGRLRGTDSSPVSCSADSAPGNSTSARASHRTAR